TVEMRDATEKELFPRLLCQCGGCARLPLSGCVCPEADQTRAEIRARLRAGVSPGVILPDYVTAHGAGALTVPPNKAALPAMYVAAGLMAAAGVGVGLVVVRRWKRRGDEALARPKTASGPAPPDEYDAKLDEELKKLDG